jgi:Predicted DNA-binding protein with an HTH domain
MTTTIELDKNTAARIDALAARTGHDKATLLRMLIESGIEDLEDSATADEILERIHRGEEKTFTDGDVRAELGLDD